MKSFPNSYPRGAGAREVPGGGHGLLRILRSALAAPGSSTLPLGQQPWRGTRSPLESHCPLSKSQKIVLVWVEHPSLSKLSRTCSNIPSKGWRASAGQPGRPGWLSNLAPEPQGWYPLGWTATPGCKGKMEWGRRKRNQSLNVHFSCYPYFWLLHAFNWG